MKSKFYWLYLFLVAILLILIPFNLLVLAQGTGSINFSYVDENVEFRLYKVGNITSNGGFVLNDKFSSYSVDLSDTNTPRTLTDYIKRDNISPDKKANTNSEHYAMFNNLDVGIYLIEGDNSSVGRTTYIPSPVIVAVKANELNVTVKAKYEINTKPSGGGGGGGGGGTHEVVNYQEVSVLKVWDGDSGKTPVVVQLLRNGNVYSEFTLNEDNNWKHTWKNLSESDDWSVVEKTVVDNYKVSVEKDGTVYIIKNTYTPPEKPTEKTTEKPTETTTNEQVVETTTTNPVTPPDDNPPGDNPDNPSGGGSTPPEPNENTEDNPGGDGGTPEEELGELSGSADDLYSTRKNKKNSDNPGNSSPGNSASGGRLPQTGQLWWPVPLFACVGVLFIIIGMSYRREDNRYEC